MSKVLSESGIEPKTRKYIDELVKIVSGDVAIAVTPATCGSSAAKIAAAIAGTAGKYQRRVTIEGPQLFNGSLSIAVTKSSTSGVVAISGGASTVQFKDGVAEVVLDYTGTWAADDTATLTVSGSIAGTTLTSKTSVDTVIA